MQLQIPPPPQLHQVYKSRNTSQLIKAPICGTERSHPRFFAFLTEGDSPNLAEGGVPLPATQDVWFPWRWE